MIINKNESLAIVIPTYKEADNMHSLMAEIKPLTRVVGNIFVYLIDDSPEEPGDTLQAARGASEFFDLPVMGIRRSRKMGLGTAYKVGFRKAIDEGHSFIAQMDADLSHAPAALIPMVTSLKDYSYEVTVGSRYQIGGRTEGWSMGRKILSRVANEYYRRYLRLNVQDATSGFKVFRAATLEATGFEDFKANDFGFQLEMAQACARLGVRMREHPITFRDRTAGESKMSIGVALNTLRRVRRL